jgi:lysophospholipase L1-like esterase
MGGAESSYGPAAQHQRCGVVASVIPLIPHTLQIELAQSPVGRQCHVHIPEQPHTPESPRAPGGVAGTDAAPPIKLGGAGRYVSLGDSYSAGEGLPPYEPGTQDPRKGGDRCHRSAARSYPKLLTFVQSPTREDFRACSGAVIDNVFVQVQDHDGVPDRQGIQGGPGILGSDTRLVTLTMGGNDLDFASVLNNCFWHKHCVDRPYKESATLRGWIADRLLDMKGALLGLFQRLRQEAPPTARIVVLGYPALFPAKAPPLRPRNAKCRLLFHFWDSSERDAVRAWGLDLNGVIQADARQGGIDYADVFPFFVGHEPCGMGDAWVRFIGLIKKSIRDGSFHPTEEGQQMMARIVQCYLYVYPSASASWAATQAQRFELTGCVVGGLTALTPTGPSP